MTQNITQENESQSPEEEAAKESEDLVIAEITCKGYARDTILPRPGITNSVGINLKEQQL